MILTATDQKPAFCAVCTTAPASRHPNTGCPTRERAYWCCDDCDAIAQPSWAPALPMPPIDQVREICALQRRIRAIQFGENDLRTESAACRAIRGAAHGGKQAFHRAPRVRINFDRWLRPDGALSFVANGRVQLIALEVKLLSGRSGDAAETARGLGQCIQYGAGLSDSGERVYYASVLVLLDGARKRNGSAWPRPPLCVHQGYGDFHWLYQLEAL